MTTALRAPRQHAVWTAPLPAELGAPAKRTIHVLRSPVDPGAPLRVGFRPGLGYLKCGSREETDWVRDARIHLWQAGAWRLAATVDELPRPAGDDTTWVDVASDGASAALVEIRRSWIDDWWPGWNLAEHGVLIEPLPRTGPPMPPRGHLDAEHVSLSGLPAGVEARRIGSMVRYDSEVLRVGFRLNAPAFAELAFDPDGLPDRPLDLVRKATLFDHTGVELINNAHHPLRGVFANGPRFTSVDGVEPIGYLAGAFTGSTSIDGNRVRYRVQVPSIGLEYDITWTVERDALSVDITRTGERELVGAESAAWQVPFSSAATPLSPVAPATRMGETGLVPATGLLHAPGSGSLAYRTSGDLLVRVDSARPQMVVDLELKVGERATELGSWHLPAGRWSGAARFEVSHGVPPRVRADAPDEVRRAVARTWLTGLSYRADTATLSNNGNSIHATFCLDFWVDLALAVGPITDDLHATDLVLDTIERHLDGAPGYGAGRTSAHDEGMEGEYLHTDISVLYAIGRLLQAGLGDRLQARSERIQAIVQALRGRDLDGDGLVESRVRTGTPGSNQWGTNWWDLIGFGWKDAWLNGILYGGLRLLAEHGSPLGIDAPALDAWADRLRDSFLAEFRNPETGWIAGWRDQEGGLHDHAFLYVNGVAINEGLLDEGEARAVAERLLDLLDREGPPDLRAGLPGNLRVVPDELMADVFPDMGFGFYENGAQTLSQARHFIAALYRVGLADDADRILLPMLAALADGSAFGGCASGVDWRLWDGTPCGYEGILTDQFGVLSPALARWGER